jgi:hypothetical protein
LLPFSAALLLPLARRDLSSIRLLFCFGILVWRARLLLRGGGRYELRDWRRDQSDGKHGDKRNLQ